MKSKILKQVSIFLYLFSLCTILLGLGCDGENTKDTTENLCPKSYETIKSIKNEIGIMGFDSTNNEYVINIHKEGTIDEIITAYPCKLSEEFKKIGLKVIVEGNLFIDANLPAPSLGGQEIFRVDIKAISITN